MKLVNKHKINKLQVGDIVLECSAPQTKVYKTKTTRAKKETKALESLDADLFYHEQYDSELE